MIRQRWLVLCFMITCGCGSKPAPVAGPVKSPPVVSPPVVSPPVVSPPVVAPPVVAPTRPAPQPMTSDVAPPVKQVASEALSTTGYVRAVALSDDGKVLIEGSEGATWRAWDLPAKTQRPAFASAGGAGKVALARQAPRVAAMNEEAQPAVWDTDTGALIRAFAEVEGSTGSLALSADGKLVAKGQAGNMIHIWQVDDGQLVKAIDTGGGLVTGVVFAPDAKSIACGIVGNKDDHHVQLRSVATGEVLREFSNNARPMPYVWGIGYSDDGRFVALASEDGVTRIWDANSGSLKHSLKGAGSTYCVAFSSDGTQIAAACEDWRVRIWTTTDGQLVHTLTGHTKAVRCVVFSRDGKTLVSGADKEMRVWKL
jgi:WD40 repeat protein